MRAQHQTTMTVHVRKLNRGMKQSTTTINQSKQAKQQKPEVCFGWAEGVAMGVKGGAHGASSATHAALLCY